MILKHDQHFQVSYFFERNEEAEGALFGLSKGLGGLGRSGDFGGSESVSGSERWLPSSSPPLSTETIFSELPFW